MSATAAPAASDRSDVRTVTVGGALVGATTAVAVVLVVAASRLFAGSASVAGGVEALVVLVAATLVAFVPGQRTAARTTEGIAGAAALGLVGTVVFSAIDIALLRPLKAYPWTWDAIGGGSTWWHLPLWWMLGTFLAWMGGIVTARSAAAQGALVRVAAPTVAGTLLVTALARLAGWAMPLPVVTGGAFTVVLVALALVALARKG
jgi:hypothetical protein